MTVPAPLPCHMSVAHDPHPWDTEDRQRLRYTCPGLVTQTWTATVTVTAPEGKYGDPRFFQHALTSVLTEAFGPQITVEPEKTRA